ncbi:MAG: phosphoglycolate phosphatase [Acidobacteria bacterium]|nr:MAG: phosphoglycolate phosphatase [Acidobacteriota bacterium]
MPLFVFDLDGTLIDSRRDLADAANALLEERGGAPLPVDTIARMVGEGAALLVRRALTAAALDPESPGALPRFLELYDDRLLTHTQLYDGIREAIETLAADAPLAVLTNKPSRATLAILDGLGVAGFFKWILGGDGPWPRKPSPAPLQELMHRAGTALTQTVMVGDSAIDLATARAARTRVCMVRYGFGFTLSEHDLGPDDMLVDRPSDLVPLLRSIRV